MAARPEECATMAALREAIDALDVRLVELLAERAGYIDRAAELKAEAGLPAEIPARVDDVIAKVRHGADLCGLDPEFTERLWRDIIAWSIARERERLEPPSSTTT